MTFKIFQKITNDLLGSKDPEKNKILAKIYSNELVVKKSFKTKKQMAETLQTIVDDFSHKNMSVRNQHDLFDFMVQV